MASRSEGSTARGLSDDGEPSVFLEAGSYLLSFLSSHNGIELTNVLLAGPSLEVIKRLGYDAPTSIQAQAIPAIMSGRDVIGVAKTGSGKTIAFLLPLLRHINDQRGLESGEGPMAVVMTPTRELALQIAKEIKPFAKVLGITVRRILLVNRWLSR